MSEFEFHPTGLSKDGDERQLIVTWNDNHVQRIAYRKLRDSCPCAHCIDKRKKEAEARDTKSNQPMELKILSPAELQPLDIVAMSPIGNYAYGIQFSDGHSSGIFSFSFLRSL